MVASSKTPSGPFTVVTPATTNTVEGGGDFTLMITNGTGYIAYDAWSNSHTVQVQQINDDYTDVLPASSGPISKSSNEAPILFERKGWFYLMYGHTCCFCRQGSDAITWTAQNPLGPWTEMYDINPGKSNKKAIKA